MSKIIVCVDQNFGIGKDNDMPWGRSLQSDLDFFKETTINQNVLMGYNTFVSILESLGKPLPKRESYVLTSKQNLSPVHDNVHFINHFDEAPKDFIVVGGGSIYKHFLDNNLISEIHLTMIHESFECDTFFPNVLDSNKWEVLSKKDFEKDEKNAFDFSFLHLKRRS